MATDKSMSVDVIGLRDLQKALKSMEDDAPKQLRQANKKAAEIVADRTRSNYRDLPGPAHRVIPTIRALAQQRSAAVKIGGARHPYTFGVEFGGGKHGKGNPTPRGGYTTQFQRARKGGYGVYPAIKSENDRVVEAYGDALDELIRKHW